jgi:thiamine-phosphate pyrophosphorylase
MELTPLGRKAGRLEVSPRMKNYAFSDGRFLGGVEHLPEWVAGLESAGVDLVQIREKSLSTRELVHVVAACLVNCRRIRLLVSARVDVALACGAHGVHLPGDSPPASAWRAIVPPGFLIGASCHSTGDARSAQLGGADFVVAAPVFDPLSKEAYRQALGIEELRRICHTVTLPVFALGGITRQNALECLAAGAAGVAGITLYRG